MQFLVHVCISYYWASGRKFFPFKNVIIPSCVTGVCLTLYPTQGNESAKINLTVCQIILPSVLKNSIFKLPQEKCHSRSFARNFSATRRSVYEGGQC
jgi:hypothetical protein